MVQRVSLVITILFCIVTRDSISEDRRSGNARDRIVAKVNGLPIHESDVFSTGQLDEVLDVRRAAVRMSMIRQTIDNELICQEARRKGVDKDPEYVRARAAQRASLDLARAQALANVLMLRCERLRHARDLTAITDEAVDAFRKEHAAAYAELVENRANATVKRHLMRQRYVTACQALLTELAAEMPITADGETVATEGVLQALEAATRLGLPAKGSAADAQNPLLKAVAAAAGVELPLGKEDSADPEIARALEKKFKAVRIGVGSSKFRVGDLYVEGQPVTAVILAQAVSTFILSEEAKRQGLETEPDTLRQVAAGRMISFDAKLQIQDGDPERQLLVRTFLEREGFYNFDMIEVSDADIHRYYEANRGKFNRIADRENGMEKIRELIRNRLQMDRGVEAKEVFVQGLRKEAGIEVFE